MIFNECKGFLILIWDLHKQIARIYNLKKSSINFGFLKQVKILNHRFRGRGGGGHTRIWPQYRDGVKTDDRLVPLCYVCWGGFVLVQIQKGMIRLRERKDSSTKLNIISKFNVQFIFFSFCGVCARAQV